MIRDGRQAEFVEDFVDFIDIVKVALDEEFDDEICLAAVRQRIASAFQQHLRFIKRELQTECEGENRFFGGMVVFVIFHSGKMRLREIGISIEIDISDALFLDELEEQVVKAWLKHFLEAMEQSVFGRMRKAAFLERTRGECCTNDEWRGKASWCIRRNVMLFQIALDIFQESFFLVIVHFVYLNGFPIQALISSISFFNRYDGKSFLWCGGL